MVIQKSKTIGNKVFCLMNKISGAGSVPRIVLMDPDPGGPKTNGSNGSESRTLENAIYIAESSVSDPDTDPGPGFFIEHSKKFLYTCLLRSKDEFA